MRSVGASFARPLKVWAVTDGRAGIEAQALGLAEAIARRTLTQIDVKHVMLRSPWSWLPSGFVPAPRQTLTAESDPIAGPWPDVWIGCGRASIPLSMGVRAWSRRRTFVVQLQDPRVNPREFDLVVPPAHDGLDGQNVMPILGACHRVTQDKLASALAEYPVVLEDLPGPRIALLIGGKSKRQDIGAARAQTIAGQMADLVRATGGSLMATLSRRTGDAARLQFRARLAPHCALFYEGDGPNPYFAMLAAADAIVMTPDSVSMPSEAAATGKPIHFLEVDGAGGKLDKFVEQLEARGIARPFDTPLAHWTYDPLRETDRVAAAVLTQLVARNEAR